MVAADARSGANWCLLLGGAVLMFVADRLADTDRDARTLAKGSTKPLAEIRFDVFVGRRPRRQILLLSLALAGLVTWGLLRVTEGGRAPAGPPAASRTITAPIVTLSK